MLTVVGAWRPGGWEIISRGENEVQMRRPKGFSFGWAFFWFLFFGIGVFIYLIYHWLKSEQLAFLRIVDGELDVTERRGLVGAYLHWAGSRESPVAKTLAYGWPIGAVLVIIIIIAVASSGGGDDGGSQEAVSAEPSPTLAAEESPTAEPPTDGEVQETPEPTPEPEEPSIERIVAAVPGAVAEARGVRITLNDIIDPWVSPSDFVLDEPDPGNRFVVFDVTIEYVKESGTHLACDFNFRLTDADAFAYDAALLFDLEPTLDCIDLGGGQKTRGLTGFEVGEASQLVLLKYDPELFNTDDIEFQFQ